MVHDNERSYVSINSLIFSFLNFVKKSVHLFVYYLFKKIKLLDGFLKFTVVDMKIT